MSQAGRTLRRPFASAESAWRWPVSPPTVGPTRRGLGVLATLVLAFVMAWVYGLRSLHAIMIPLAVVSVAALVVVLRTAKPEVHRTVVEDGFIGERRTVEVVVDVDDPVAATLYDSVGEGCTPVAGGIDQETILGPDGRFAYHVTFDRRGEHAFGPLTIVVTDPLGLFRRRFEDDRTVLTVVYPRVYDLRDANGDDLRLLADVADTGDREEFDHLREYTRGDSVRHVHWKSAAKRHEDELLVKEFADDVDRGAANVVAECVPGCEDEMASAAATVATYLLRAGVSVGVTLPEDERRPGSGRKHHRDLLETLAVADPGEVDSNSRERADVLIQADASGTVVVVGEYGIPFERLRGARVDGRARGSSVRRPDERSDGGHHAGTVRHPNHVSLGSGARRPGERRGTET